MKHLEDDHQKALVEWAKYTALPAHIQVDYPKGASVPKVIDYLIAIPNGGKRSKSPGRNGKMRSIEASRMKGLGVKAGVSDLFLAIRHHGMAGLWIEMKKPVTDFERESAAVTAFSEDQRLWIDRMQRQGYGACVCYGWDAAKELIDAYLSQDRDAYYLIIGATFDWLERAAPKPRAKTVSG